MNTFDRYKHITLVFFTQLVRHDKWQMLLNALLFQCLWFSIMVFDQLGLLLLLMALGLQFLIQYYSKDDVSLLLPLVVFIVGVGVDTNATMLEMFLFPIDEPDLRAANLQLLPMPFWLIALWAGFALTLQNSLQWLRERWYFCVLGFAVFGPISYIAGRSFEMIAFDNKMIFYLVIEWAFIGWLASFSFNDYARNGECE